jgi:hypothetical protein
VTRSSATLSRVHAAIKAMEEDKLTLRQDELIQAVWLLAEEYKILMERTLVMESHIHRLTK